MFLKMKLMIVKNSNKTLEQIVLKAICKRKQSTHTVNLRLPTLICTVEKKFERTCCFSQPAASYSPSHTCTPINIWTVVDAGCVMACALWSTVQV